MCKGCVCAQREREREGGIDGGTEREGRRGREGEGGERDLMHTGTCILCETHLRRAKGPQKKGWARAGDLIAYKCQGVLS